MNGSKDGKGEPDEEGDALADRPAPSGGTSGQEPPESPENPFGDLGSWDAPWPLDLTPEPRVGTAPGRRPGRRVNGHGAWAWLRRMAKALKIREPFCGLSHFAGAILSVAALVVLLVLARGQLRPLVGFAVYGVSLITLYLASALSHSLHVNPRTQELLNRLDYIAIFLLIAGTCTPLCLVSLRGAWGWGVLGAEYGLALIGIVSTLVWKRMPHAVRLVLYVSMGCLMIAVLPPLRAVLPPAAITWLLGGGIVYLAGMAVLALDRPDLWPGRNRTHDLWHVFVLGGSACHFVLMLCFVAPAI